MYVLRTDVRPVDRTQLGRCVSTTLIHRETVNLEKAIVYAEREGYRALELDLYRPTHASGGPRPLIVYVHGGGWRQSHRSRAPRETRGWDRGFFERLIEAGFTVAAPDYRLSVRIEGHGLVRGTPARRADRRASRLGRSRQFSRPRPCGSPTVSPPARRGRHLGAVRPEHPLRRAPPHRRRSRRLGGGARSRSLLRGCAGRRGDLRAGRRVPPGTQSKCQRVTFWGNPLSVQANTPAGRSDQNGRNVGASSLV